MRAGFVALTAIALVALTAGCSKEAPGDVEMTDAHRFEPARLVVSTGEKVTFANNSAEVHTVTAYQNGIPQGADYFASGGAESEDEARDNLDQGLLKDGETYSATFKTPGTYRYFCIPHEQQGMKGTIVVKG